MMEKGPGGSLRDLIYLGSESRHLEYKESMTWEDELTKAKITRAILAFSNTRDGGAIIVGVKQNNNSFSFDGMTEEHLKTLDHDIIAKHVANYADPHVEFAVSVVEDDGKKFIVIQVQEFAEIPVICKKDGKDLKRGAMYTRMKGKPGSAEVSIESEMREIMDMAVDKGIRKFYERIEKTRLSFSQKNKELDTKFYQDELSRINISDVMREIRSKGYWRIIVRPTAYDGERIPNLAKTKEIIRDSRIELTGWPYPYFLEHEIKKIEKWIECQVHHLHFLEYWRFYRSSQFYHLMGLIEDWIGFKDPPEGIFGPKTPSSKVLSIEVTTQLLTEIFEFAVRLSQKDVLGDEVYMSIELNDMKDRTLFWWDSKRYMSGTYTSLTPTILLENVLKVEELVANAHKLAIDNAIRLFDLFDWDEVPRRVLEDIQQKMLSRQL